mgnify:CR=1 FL=1
MTLEHMFFSHICFDVEVVKSKFFLTNKFKVKLLLKTKLKLASVTYLQDEL